MFLNFCLLPGLGNIILYYLWQESYDKPRHHVKKQRHHFANKGPYSQSYGLSSSHVQMWELDHKEGWLQKKTDAFEFFPVPPGKSNVLYISIKYWKVVGITENSRAGEETWRARTRRWLTNLYKVTWVDFIKKMKFQQRLEGGERVTHVHILGQREQLLWRPEANVPTGLWNFREAIWLSNCGAGEDSSEPLYSKEVK